jgi:hypothetical protein
MNKDLYLPVSIGEALDKLTILDIKLEFIKDNRRNLVQIEYDALYEKLQFYVDNNNEYYKLLKQVNLDIWYMMDILRDSNITDDKYIIQCKECIEANDMRFRIKNKINISSNSLLKEQKGYNVLRVIFDLNDMNADINEIIHPIKYYSYLYDEIIILTTDNKNMLELIFNYDPTIKIMDTCDLDYKQKFNFRNMSINNVYDTLKITEDIKKKYFI